MSICSPATASFDAVRGSDLALSSTASRSSTYVQYACGRATAANLARSKPRTATPIDGIAAAPCESRSPRACGSICLRSAVKTYKPPTQTPPRRFAIDCQTWGSDSGTRYLLPATATGDSPPARLVPSSPLTYRPRRFSAPSNARNCLFPPSRAVRKPMTNWAAHRFRGV